MFDYTLKALRLVALFCLLIFLIVDSIAAQNLLANGDFEDLNACSEFKVSCAPEAWFRYPPIELDLYLKDADLVYEGKNAEVIIIENRKFPVGFRLDLYSMLLCPLSPGEEYILSFYLNPIYDKEYELNVLFTSKELRDRSVEPIGMKPDLIFVNEATTFRRNKWIYNEKRFIADGDEVFINFGNFSPDVYSFDKYYFGRKLGNEIVYLIDNVKLIKSDSTNSPDCDLEIRRDLLYKSDRRHSDDEDLLVPETPVEKIAESKQELNITIPDIAFNTNQYEINNNYHSTLDSLIERMKELDIKLIRIIGHTDDVGSEQYNKKLSENRANSVLSYLQKSIDIPFATSGMGELDPIFSNTSNENRRLNRRVEVIIELASD